MDAPSPRPPISRGGRAASASTTTRGALRRCVLSLGGAASSSGMPSRPASDTWTRMSPRTLSTPIFTVPRRCGSECVGRDVDHLDREAPLGSRATRRPAGTRSTMPTRRPRPPAAPRSTRWRLRSPCRPRADRGAWMRPLRTSGSCDSACAWTARRSFCRRTLRSRSSNLRVRSWSHERVRAERTSCTAPKLARQRALTPLLEQQREMQKRVLIRRLEEERPPVARLGALQVRRSTHALSR